jgi:hypothetical protein
VPGRGDLPEDALPDKWEPFVKINYAYPDSAAIDQLVDQVKPTGVSRRYMYPSFFQRRLDRGLLSGV